MNSLARTLSAFVLLAPLALGDELSDLEGRFRKADDAEARVALLDEGNLLYGVEGVDSEDVTGFLSDGLEDDDLTVRTRAAELLGECSDDENASAALERAARDFKKLYESHVKDEAARRERMAKERQELAPLSAETVEWMEDLVAAMEKDVQVWTYSKSLGEALGKRRNEACTRGLLSMLEGLGGQPFSTDIIASLLDIGTYSAVEGVIESVESNRDRQEEAEDDLKKASRARPSRRPPDYWKGSKDAWKKQERERIERGVESAEKTLRSIQGWRVTLRERLAAFAEERGLTPPPRKLDRSRDCRNWLRENAELLPETLEPEAGTPGE